MAEQHRPGDGRIGKHMAYRRFVSGRVAAVLVAALVMMAGPAEAQTSVKVFVDCAQCDFNNLRQDIIAQQEFLHLTVVQIFIFFCCMEWI